MARQPTTQFGPEITQTSDLRSSVTPQQGVAQQPVLLEGIGRLFDQASSAFESAREAKSQASVADFVKRQTMVADALAQGQISSSAHARTIMRKNFLEALDANPTLWKDLAGAHASIIGTPGLGEVAAAGTEEEQAKMARRDALVSAGQLSYDADDQTFERVDSNVRLAQEAERQHTMRMQTLDEELKQGQVTAQRKKEIEEERAQANVDFFRQAAPVEMNSVRTEFETILNSNMSEADKLVALDDYWVNWNNKLSDKFGSASEREVQLSVSRLKTYLKAISFVSLGNLTTHSLIVTTRELLPLRKLLLLMIRPLLVLLLPAICSVLMALPKSLPVGVIRMSSMPILSTWQVGTLRMVATTQPSLLICQMRLRLVMPTSRMLVGVLFQTTRELKKRRLGVLKLPCRVWWMMAIGSVVIRRKVEAS